MFIFLIVRLSERRNTIAMRKDKFWSLVQSQDKPIVLLTTSGRVFKKLIYVFPYQGILFVTNALGTSTPDGVKLIPTNEVFDVPNREDV